MRKAMHMLLKERLKFSLEINSNVELREEIRYDLHALRHRFVSKLQYGHRIASI